jgi:hypothetical protein
MGPALLGYVEGRDYMDARHRAERTFGKQIEVYLPPAQIATITNQPEKKCGSPKSMIACMSSTISPN